MKKVLSFMFAAAFAFAACTPEEKVVPVVDVTMSSFGFYAVTNDALKSDFVVENPSDNIRIVLPYGTEDETLKSLVPTFAVTEGAAVTVDGTDVESGVTAIDFSHTVEFLVTVNEKSNAQYTVTVSVSGPSSFAVAAKTEEKIDKGPYLRISPKDNSPYIAAVLDAEDAAQKYPVLFRYDGAVLSSFCTVAEERADQPTLGFAEDGTPYFAFYNYNAKFLNVYKIDGTSASAVGDLNLLYRPLTNSVYSTVGVAPVSSSSVYVGYGVNAASGSLARRALNLCHWDGSSWTQEIAVPGRNVSDYAYESFTKLVNGEQYLMVFNQNVQNLSMYKFTGNGVSTVFENLAFNKLGTEEQGKINLYGLDFDIASDGTPYILALVEASSTVGSGYSPAVYRYNASDNSTSIVGGVMQIDGQVAKYFSLAMDSNDVPYMAYCDPETKYATYTYIDSKSKVWAEAKTLSSVAAENISIAFAGDGTGYIACNEGDLVSLYSTSQN